MWLLAGLGNPGARYASNRHNIGFLAVDRIANAYRFSPFAKKFGGLLADGAMDGNRALLLKPQTFMNESGQSVGEALRFFKIPPEQLIVFHDELDLPLGRLRVKQGGSAGGHNGLKSIDAHIGENYWRVRLGISHPGDKDQVTGHVLSDFNKAEVAEAERILESITKYINLLISGDSSGFMSKVAQENPGG